MEECATSVPHLAHLTTSNSLAVTDKDEQLLLSLRRRLDTGVPALAQASLAAPPLRILALAIFSTLSAYVLTYAWYTEM